MRIEEMDKSIEYFTRLNLSIKNNPELSYKIHSNTKTNKIYINIFNNKDKKYICSWSNDDFDLIGLLVMGISKIKEYLEKKGE